MDGWLLKQMLERDEEGPCDMQLVSGWMLNLRMVDFVGVLVGAFWYDFLGDERGLELLWIRGSGLCVVSATISFGVLRE